MGECSALRTIGECSALRTIGECLAVSASSTGCGDGDTAIRLKTEPNAKDQSLVWRLLHAGVMFDRADKDALEERTRRFAIDIVHLVRDARAIPELRPACDQLNRSAGSVAANHRSASRARSTKEFAAKLQIVHEEADECAHWLSQLEATNRDAVLRAPIERALKEAVELRNIFGRARATTRDRYFSERNPRGAG